MWRTIYYFIRERIGWISLCVLQIFFILIYLYLYFYFHKQAFDLLIADWGYLLLLTGTLLLLFLVIQFIRWYPFYRRTELLLHEAEKMDDFGHLGKVSLAEHKRFYQVMRRLYQVASQEKNQYEDVHQQHLEYMNLWVHEMKTPLASLSLILQKMDIHALPEEERNHMKSMEEEIEKLNDELDKVLNMARLNDFATDYHIRPVSLLESVREVIHHKKKSFIRLGIFPKIEADQDEDWEILTDRKWNQFAIEQIVQNALKYASKMEERSYLTFRFLKKKKSIYLLIEDQGPGIPKQDLPRIFDPFFTGENGRRFSQATGMGLYLVRKVFTALSHEITAESEEGKGATFILTYSIHK
jgi:signal transduction histidine kinase